uniref:Uncharacterized protein n=1 Tax=Aplanochytrium stocchinoi TaxID=215587 RepID=A0A7S3UYT6_9STRA|mmetsp:Transcript_21755/g.26398  ORF Transcript_21755/g.26398 Transcript_21755/m.26398 type:complete len:291 (-) Transcript_21755:1567-2439(-)
MDDVELAGGGALPPWLFRLVNNLGVYFIFFGIGYLALRHVRNRPAPEPSDRDFLPTLVRFLFFGPGVTQLPTNDDGTSAYSSVTKEVETSLFRRAAKLCFCVTGLLTSFLSWGLLQERVMTTEYTTGRFQSSNFMVFCSRSVGLIVALLVINFTQQKTLKAPFYKYSFTSLSNVLSSWCQLEALKYLSFPTQVLGKSSKMIPVMIMGKVISKKKYPWYEYIVAVVILFGVAVFILAENSDKANNSEQQASTSCYTILFNSETISNVLIVFRRCDAKILLISQLHFIFSIA